MLPTRKSTSNVEGSLTELVGLGPASKKMLNAAGIHTCSDLEVLGPVRAYIAVIESGQEPSLNLLWAIAGGLLGVHWSKLPEDYRGVLLRDYDALCDLREHD